VRQSKNRLRRPGQMLGRVHSRDLVHGPQLLRTYP
jgi:tRNA A-37 threonylcarbamoyl transferase component Bud32